MGKQNSTPEQWAKKGWAMKDGTLQRIVADKPGKVKKIGSNLVFDKKVLQHQLAPIEFNEINEKTSREVTLDIKPLSVNECWRGQRFKTDKYIYYATWVTIHLPNDIIIPTGLFKVYYEFGMSNHASDWDNPCKPLQDILQERYKFNDKNIMEATVRKVIVPKGTEYIKFRFEVINEL